MTPKKSNGALPSPNGSERTRFRSVAECAITRANESTIWNPAKNRRARTLRTATRMGHSKFSNHYDDNGSEGHDDDMAGCKWGAMRKLSTLSLTQWPSTFSSPLQSLAGEERSYEGTPFPKERGGNGESCRDIPLSMLSRHYLSISSNGSRLSPLFFVSPFPFFKSWERAEPSLI